MPVIAFFWVKQEKVCYLNNHEMEIGGLVFVSLHFKNMKEFC